MRNNGLSLHFRKYNYHLGRRETKSRMQAKLACILLFELAIILEVHRLKQLRALRIQFVNEYSESLKNKNG